MLNSERTRRYHGLILHYLRCMRPEILHPAVLIMFGILIIMGIGVAIAFFGNLRWSGRPESSLINTLNMTEESTVMMLLGCMLMFMMIFYQRSQRQEMLTILMWPAERECFALMKLFDGNAVLLYVAVFLMSALITTYVLTRSLLDGLRMTALAVIFMGHMTAAYISAGMFIVLAGVLYMHFPSNKVRFPVFLSLWLTCGLLPVAYGYLPPSGLKPYVEAGRTGWVHFWVNLLEAGPIGALAAICIVGVGVSVLLLLALTVIGWAYVDHIQRIEDSIIAAQMQVKAPLGTLRLRYLPFISRPLQAIWFKDLGLLLRRPLLLLSFLFSLAIVIVYVAVADLSNLLMGEVELINIIAVWGAILFEIHAVEIFGMDGRGAESLAQYPVSGRQLLLGKTLCGVSLHLPLMIFFLFNLIWSGFAPHQIGAFMFWLCWLFPFTLTQIGVGALMNIRSDDPVDRPKIVLANLLTVPVSFGYIVLYFVLYLLARSSHWLLFPIFSLGFLLLYTMLARQTIRLLPGLRIWGVEERHPRRVSRAGRPMHLILQTCLTAIPVFLVYTYLSAGLRPLRLFPLFWRIILLCVPILVALILVTNRIRGLFRFILLMGLLLALMVAVAVSHGNFDYGILGRIFAYPVRIGVQLEAIAEESFEQEMNIDVLPAEVAREFGYDPNEIYRMAPPPSAENLLEFLTALRNADMYYEIWEDKYFQQWLRPSINTIAIPERQEIWFKSVIHPSDHWSYHRFMQRMFFVPAGEWTPEDLYRLIDMAFRHPGLKGVWDVSTTLELLPLNKLTSENSHELLQILKEHLFQTPLPSPRFVDQDYLLRRYFEVVRPVEDMPLYFQLLVLLPGSEAFDFLQELLYARQVDPDIQLPPRDRLVHGSVKPGIEQLRMLWQDYPKYAVFLSRKHPLLVGDRSVVEALPRLTDLSEESLEYATHFLSVIVQQFPGVFSELELTDREVLSLVQRLDDRVTLPLEDAHVLMEIVRLSPEYFTDKGIRWYKMFSQVPPDEYTDFGITLLLHGGSLDFFPVRSYNVSDENPESLLTLERLCERIIECCTEKPLQLDEYNGGHAHRLYAALFQLKGRETAIRFLRAIEAEDHDIQILLDVLTESTEIDLDLLYTRSQSFSFRWGQKFEKEALLRVLLDRGEIEEAEFIARLWEPENWAHIPELQGVTNTSIRSDYMLTALGYTALFVLTGIGLSIVAWSRQKNVRD